MYLVERPYREYIIYEFTDLVSNLFVSQETPAVTGVECVKRITPTHSYNGI